ncbi:MAG: DUF4011 domain-containing protein [Cytophagales bacterium]|nr:DUF4011 domain-containing protein [Cytophagales bacterium]
MLLRLLKSQDIDVHNFDFLTNQASYTILERIIKGKKKIPLCAVVDSRLEENNKVSKQLKQIHRKNKQIFEELGAQDLYIGWPFVEGKLLNDSLIRCPLIFFPVRLSSENNTWHLELREEVNITFNKSFLLAFSFFNNTKISDDLLDTAFNEFPKNLQAFKNELYDLTEASPLEINFNQHLFENTLLPFTRYTKQDYSLATQKGVLKLQNQAVMGLFPQADSYLVPDYEWLEQQINFPSLEEFFLSKTIDLPISIIKEEQTFTPFELDAFQERAIHEVKKGKSISVQGPPGTGKSQLICNLVTDFVARGKRVLVVCQKKAALDVVYERLSQKEIEDFVGQINDFKTDRSRIFQQINLQIDNSPDYQRQNNLYNTVELDRTFINISRKIDQITEELTEFKEAFFDTKECGTNVKELYLKSNRKAPHISLTEEYKNFDIYTIEPFVQRLQNYLPYVFQYHHKEHPWFERKSFSSFSIEDLNNISQLLSEIPNYISKFREQTQQNIQHTIDFEDAEWLLDRKEDLAEIRSLLNDPEIFKFFQHFGNHPPQEEWLLLQEYQLLNTYRDKGMETSLEGKELAEVRNLIQEALNSFQRFDKKVLWKVRNRKAVYRLQKLIVQHGFDWGIQGLKKLAHKIDNRLNFQHKLKRISEQDWVIDIPQGTDLTLLDNWFYQQHVAIKAYQLVQELQNYREILGFYTQTYSVVCQRMDDAINFCQEAVWDEQKWLKYLSQSQIHDILQNKNTCEELKESLELDFDNLCEFDKQKESFQQYELNTIDKVLKEVEEQDIQTCISFFENSIYCSWIYHIERKYPALRIASSLKIEQLEQELQNLIPQKRQLTKEILQIKLREMTYRDFNYNRLHNLTTYRDLKKQVTKKRQLWSLRKTFEHFSDEIFNLVPCWLASPESVSAIFPMESYFDLVIFDEASQCFAEKSIPALYRGKQIIITGDEQQLPPNDLYKVRWEEENEEEEIHTDIDIESLLTLSNQYLKQTTLQEHYRSQSLDLIAFSNHHFYDNKLRLLPQLEKINSAQSNLHYHKVKGTWEYNQNLEEAHTIVDMVHKWVKEGITNIGIVTFNVKQQESVQDILERSWAGEETSFPSEIFVKNIENVQGDERDIIIFSIGYAPSSSGKISLNFGSLNTEKGENRLNVAITRARKEIHIVSSILPHQLQTENAKNRGPQLLKEYLQYVYDASNKNSNIGELETNPTKKWTGTNLKNELEQSFSPLLQSSLPFGDLEFVMESEYKGLVLTDDESYFNSISAKDTHAYFPLLLNQKNWKYVRAYSRNFWNFRKEQKQKMQGFLERNEK